MSPSQDPHWLRVLKTIGNSNILFSHIINLEMRIVDEDLKEKSLETSVDYFCWLFLYSVHVTQKLEHKYYRHNSEVSPKDKVTYKTMLAFFKEKLVDKDEKKLDLLYSVLDLRDSFIHFGTPNLIHEPINKSFMNAVLIQCKYKKALEFFNGSLELLRSIPDPVVPIGTIGQIGR